MIRQEQENISFRIKESIWAIKILTSDATSHYICSNYYQPTALNGYILDNEQLNALDSTIQDTNQWAHHLKLEIIPRFLVH